MISACVLLALGVQVSQLARTDWRQLAIGVRDALVAPITAAGDTPPPPPTGAAPSLPEPAQPGGTPLLDAASPVQAYPAGPVALAVEVEMAKLLEELKARKAAAVALPGGADLAQAALAARLERALDKLEARHGAPEEQAAGGGLAKPRAIFENMKPDEAAAILASMEEATAAEILAAMDERKAAAALASMPPDHAGRLALAIKTLAGQAPPPQP